MRFAVPRVALLAVISSTSAALFARQDIPSMTSCRVCVQCRSFLVFQPAPPPVWPMQILLVP